MDDIALVAKTLFDGVWTMLVQTKFPGTDFSLAAISIAVMIACFAIRIFSFLSGLRSGGASYGQAADSFEKAKAAYNNSRRNKIGF